MTAKRSRPQRFKQAIEELAHLCLEYEQWLEKLPDNLLESSLAEQLEDTVQLLSDSLELLDAVQLPLGFGR
jgi:hypothetical protein